MITELILNILTLPLVGLILGMSALDIHFPYNDDIANAFLDMVSCVEYVLPIRIFLICFGIKIAIRHWAIPYAIILRIKSFIPTMGH